MAQKEVRTRPILLYDGDCAFCARWIKRWERITAGKVEYQTYQHLGTDFPQIPFDQFEVSVYLVEPSGEITRAAQAVLKTLSYGRGFGWLERLYRTFPPFRWLTEFAYRSVARNRRVFSKFS